MAFNLTIHLDDEETVKLRVRDLTIGEYREARLADDTGAALDELFFDAVEEVSGYDSINDLSLTVMPEITRAITDFISGRTTSRSAGGTSANRQERRSKRKNLTG